MTPVPYDVAHALPELDDPCAFRWALAQALRRLHRRELLSNNPLIDAPFVRRWGDGTGADRLRSAIAAGVRVMAAASGDRQAAHLLEIAFLQLPRRKQLVLASELGMGFSTYRRHLSRAIDAFADLLIGVRDD
jgi:hypothetical protein